MLTVGRVCMKIAGRDAGKTAVVLDVLDKNYVLIDGDVRRRRCNILHLEPLERTVDLPHNASHAAVLKALEIEEKKTSTQTKQKTMRPQRVRRKKTYTTVKKKKTGRTQEKKPKKAQNA